MVLHILPFPLHFCLDGFKGEVLLLLIWETLLLEIAVSDPSQSSPKLVKICVCISVVLLRADSVLWIERAIVLLS